METLYYIFRAVLFFYLGFGIGTSIFRFKDGGKLCWVRNEGTIKYATQTEIILFIVCMTFTWPLYFVGSFRKKFMIVARWQ